MTTQQLENVTNEEVVLEDNELICLLTGDVKKNKGKEETVQSLIRMLNEEYGFELEDMARDFSLTGYDPDTDKIKKQKVDLVIFEHGRPHDQDHVIRLCVVQDEKIKETDKKKGVEIVLQNALNVVDSCEFGLWTNGKVYHFQQKEEDDFGDIEYVDISDFPGEGETLEDLDRSDRTVTRNPAGDSMIRVFSRCHDYIYGNEGMKKTAFWELLNLIFCKIYDERRRFMDTDGDKSYRRKFWVGIKEQNTSKGRAAVADRIKSLFEELKGHELFSEVFEGNEQISLTDKGLAFVASELARYSFLDASVDVKGTAYETIVSNTLKQEAGQFFTPRNIVRCMVEMMDPNEDQRVLDPACGSGGFLVMVLDHVRRKITKEMYPDLDGPWLEDKFNHPHVNEKVRQYAERNLFGLDFDPDLKKAARMNMVMAGDGHANIFHANSLAYPLGDNEQELKKIQNAIQNSVKNGHDKNTKFRFTDAREKFDLIFTNPPFGANIPINDPDVLDKFDLGHRWKKDEDGKWHKGDRSSSEPPEILFIDQCYQFLKPGGRMAIVLPDGILSNPNTEYVRAWILNHFRVLASIDMAVEAFLPQVGVQASLLFLQKKTDEEKLRAQLKKEEYSLFMAIAERLGHDRRGRTIYKRDEDGGELLFDEIKQYLVVDKKGKKTLKARKQKVKSIDDDLLLISKEYNNFLEEL